MINHLAHLFPDLILVQGRLSPTGHLSRNPPNSFPVASNSSCRLRRLSSAKRGLKQATSRSEDSPDNGSRPDPSDQTKTSEEIHPSLTFESHRSVRPKSIPTPDTPAASQSGSGSTSLDLPPTPTGSSQTASLASPSDPASCSDPRYLRISFHRHRTPLPIRHQSIHNDRSPVLPIPIMTMTRQRATMPLIIAARYIVKNQRSLRKMTPASFFSIRSCRANNQSIASYRSSSSASATPNSSANVVVCHKRVVANFEQG